METNSNSNTLDFPERFQRLAMDQKDKNFVSQASQVIDNAETEISRSKNSQEGEIPQTKKKAILRQN